MAVVKLVPAQLSRLKRAKEAKARNRKPPLIRNKNPCSLGCCAVGSGICELRFSFFFFISLARLCHLGSWSYSEPVSKTLDYTMKQMRVVAGPMQRALGVALACRLW